MNNIAHIMAGFTVGTIILFDIWYVGMELTSTLSSPDYKEMAIIIGGSILVIGLLVTLLFLSL